MNSVHAGLVAGSFLHSQTIATPPAGLTAGGAVMMCLSIGGVLTLVIWCYRRVLRLGNAEAGVGSPGSESPRRDRSAG